ncbi:MAG TPA: IS110 family transposase [Dehalococcoidia bacterium]|nr:IS110 family transposase [Dehalococcoidia bacterium]
MTNTTYVGMDAHKATIAVAMLLPSGELVEWQIANETVGVRRLARAIHRAAPGEVVACYEAGPCGFALQRQLRAPGLDCRVIAPALIPQQPGNRVKTDRRDARQLARLLRADLLTAVHTPTPAQEAVRDLCRAREDAVEDRTRSRHRLSKFLLRLGIVDGPRQRWTQVYRRWLSTLRFDHAAAQATCDDYVRALDDLDDRVRTLDEQIALHADTDAYREAVGVLRCFHGVDTLTALTFLAELGDLTRFASARQLMSYLDLTPSEFSSGPRQRRGGITKAGNSHVRRILIEAAWHQRHRPGVGRRLQARRRGQPSWAVACADRAQKRLHRRYQGLITRGKPSTVAAVAIARELAAFLWAAVQRLQQPAQVAA